MGALRRRANVHQLEQRIGGRLDPHHARFRPHGRRQGVRPGGVRVAERKAVGLEHAFEQPEGAGVQIVACHHMLAVFHQVQDGGRRHATGGEREAEATAFELRQAAFVSRAGRVAGARVLVTFVDARRGLHIGGGEMQRHVDGAGGGVWRLRAVNRPGLEAVRFGRGHSAASARSLP